jgi:RNA polymerase nonessential primary-like sigma factor
MESETDDGIGEVQEILRSFRGEEDLKRLFWSVLGYDRINQPIACPTLASGREELIDDVRLFAQHDQLSVVLVRTACATDRPFLMTLCHQLASRFALLVVLLQDDGGRRWQVILPDNQTKHYLRHLDIPGHKYQITQTAHALWALSCFDDVNGAARSSFDISLKLDLWFPGPQLPERTDIPELDQYLRDAQNWPLLTRHQELMPENVRRLVVHNLRLVVWLAQKFRSPGMTLADRVQAGNIGLMKAAERFDRSMGNRFSTYACHWIRQTIQREAQRAINIIYWPNHVALEFYRANCSAKNRKKLKPGERRVESLDEVAVQEAASKLPHHDVRAERCIWLEELKAGCRAAIDALPPVAQSVLAFRYGLDGRHEHTLQEIGSKLQYTRERVRQIQMAAEEHLQRELKKIAPEVFAYYKQDA